MSTQPQSSPHLTSGHSSPLYDHLARNTLARINIAHPYARLLAKRDGTRTRRIWNHVLEKVIFSPNELLTLRVPYRRTIYVASLEAHIDCLHAQIKEIGFWPVAFDESEHYGYPYATNPKSLVGCLQHHASVSKYKLLELEHANKKLMEMLQCPQEDIPLDSADSTIKSFPTRPACTTLWY
ncbi:hypothetical protein F5887DRAFT_995517 [Amanita rubescens]|nr:hypothetical protein F5887DRAFT_995517 [Amanita rubescens]